MGKSMQKVLEKNTARKGAGENGLTQNVLGLASNTDEVVAWCNSPFSFGYLSHYRNASPNHSRAWILARLDRRSGFWVLARNVHAAKVSAWKKVWKVIKNTKLSTVCYIKTILSLMQTIRDLHSQKPLNKTINRYTAKKRNTNNSHYA